MHNIESSSELAYTTVKEYILNGVLPGGELVSEGRIAEELTMSRTPVREAFLRLEAEGLMRLYPKRGALVVPVAAGEAADIARARHLVEVDAVDLLRGRDTAALTRRLEELLLAQEAALDEADMPRFATADLDFHRAIVLEGGSPILGGFYESLRDRQRRTVSHANRRDPARARTIIDEHRMLADQARARDRDGFADTLWRHLRHTHALSDAERPGAASVERGR